jgi:hypothetical protein
MGARWYDSSLGRWNQPDPYIPDPGNVQAFDRFAFTINNPIKYRDPSGHWIESAIDIISIGYDIYDISQNGLNWENGLSLAADVVSLALPVVTGGGLMVKAVTHADDIADAARATNRIAKLSDEAIAFGKNIADDLANRVHHLATNKNYKAGAKWSTVFENFLKDHGYGDLLSLDRIWNKVDIPHANKSHSSQYHQWILSAMEKINDAARGDSNKFLEYWNKYVADVVDENPWILEDAWWSEYGDEMWDWWDDVVIDE